MKKQTFQLNKMGLSEMTEQQMMKIDGGGLWTWLGAAIGAVAGAIVGCLVGNPIAGAFWGGLIGLGIGLNVDSNPPDVEKYAW